MAFVRAEHDSLSGTGDATLRQIAKAAVPPAHLDLRKPVFATGEANGVQHGGLRS